MSTDQERRDAERIAEQIRNPGGDRVAWGDDPVRVIADRVIGELAAEQLTEDTKKAGDDS